MRAAGGRTAGTPSYWSAVRLVARREFVERARDKSFLGSTVLTVLIVVGAIVVPQLLGAGDEPTYRVAFAGRDAVAVQAAAETQARTLGVQLRASTVPGTAAGTTAARAQVGAEDLDAVVDGDSGAVVVREELDFRLQAVLTDAHRQVRAAEGLAAAGLDPGRVTQASAVPALRVEALDPPDERAAARRQVALVGTLLLYGQLLGYGFWVALGVVEEKSSRVVEVLLATVPARALLAGKILGIGALGLLQLLLLAGVGLAAGSATGAVEVTADTLSTVLLVLAWFLLGYAFYSALFAAAAARVSRQEDLQNVTTPATLLVMVSFFAALYAGGSPDNAVARVLSFLPPFSALVNPPRVASGRVELWEVALAVGLMLVATAGLVLVAARLYEGAILRMGGTVSLRDAWRGGRGGGRSASPVASSR